MDRLIEEEEELVALHMKNIKEAAALLTEEGNIISKVQGKRDYGHLATCRLRRDGRITRV